ncbi:MAG: hypothetical protein U0746_20030 [Gemmataceae bacterium]
MRGIVILVGCLALAGCGPASEADARRAAAEVARVRVELAESEIERCEGDLRDAKEDLGRLRGEATPGKGVLDAKRKIGDAEHALKLARLRVKEQKALVEYAAATGRLQ